METNVTHPAAIGSAPVPSPGKPPAFKIVGIGNAGVNLVEELRQGGCESAAFAVVSDDREALAKSSAAEKIHLELGSAAGSGGRAGERSRRSSDIAWPKLKTVCGDVQTVLVVAGLGGRTGTNLSLAAAKAAKQAGAFTLAFVTLPFDCEGSLRQHNAQSGLAQIRAVADVVFCLPNQKTLSLIQDETNLVDIFKISNRLLADCLRGVCLALTTTSFVMGLPFSDLCALAQEQCGITAFAVAEAAGANRACEVLEKLFRHPLVEGGRILSEAGTILVSMVGGTDLTIAEVNRVMEKISAQCQGVPVVMGAGVRPSSNGKLAVVLMVMGTGQANKKSDKQDATSLATPVAVSSGVAPELDTQLPSSAPAARLGSLFVPPSPVLSPEQRERIIAQHAEAAARQHKNTPRLRQTQLPLELVSKGRFDKSEPTIHKGEDLDVPTFIRRGVVLN